MPVQLDKSCIDCAHFQAQSESMGSCSIDCRSEQKQKHVSNISCFFFVDRATPIRVPEVR